MKRILPKEEYVHHALQSPGIVRVNHKSDYCSGDSDSMLVERKDDGSVAAHCFRCGSGGFCSAQPYHKDADKIRSDARRRANESAYGNLAVAGLWLPDDVRERTASFPAGVRAWLSKAGLTNDVLDREQFLWSDEKETLYIPVRIEDDLTGYVRRNFGHGDRYRTLKTDKERWFGYYADYPPTEKIVLVEDILSALRVREVCDSLALLGTNLIAGAQSLIMQKGYKEAVIFLDADNPTVRSEARRMKKKLPFLPVRVIETGNDPKYYSKEQLEKLIYED